MIKPGVRIRNKLLRNRKIVGDLGICNKATKE
jgi:hypothetical protein